MAKENPSENGGNKMEAESSNNIEDGLHSCEKLNKDKEKIQSSNSTEWKHITDFAPRKSMYVKTRHKVTGAYSNLAKWTKEAIQDAKKKVSSQDAEESNNNEFKSLNKTSNIINAIKTAKEFGKEVGTKILANKIALKYSAAALVTLILVLFMFQLNLRPVVVVSIDKTPVAVVPDKKSFENILGNLQNSWKGAYKKDIKVKGDIAYKFRLLPNRMISTPKQVAEAIESHTDSLIKAKAITVNGEAKAVIKDSNSANVVLDTIKNKFASKAGKSIGFIEDVKVTDIYVMSETIQSEKDAVGALLANVEGVKDYTVKDGDTLWDIADKYNISVEKLAELNPEVGDNLTPGQVIRLTAPKSAINVKTIEYADVKEDTPYQTKFQSDPSRAKGERKVIQPGTLGNKLYRVEIIKQNGVEILRNILEEKVIQDARTEVVAVGTKPTAVRSATGAFRVPAFGSITSRYGYRWGRVHEGVDISGRTGQPIYAADGGKVIFAGVESGYGNLIKIDHGNGLVTYYGHCSKLIAKVGQSVSKGDQIALVGSTGHSTGPHLHFEVRKNGSPVDPLKYLK